MAESRDSGHSIRTIEPSSRWEALRLLCCVLAGISLLPWVCGAVYMLPAADDLGLTFYLAWGAWPVGWCLFGWIARQRRRPVLAVLLSAIALVPTTVAVVWAVVTSLTVDVGEFPR